MVKKNKYNDITWDPVTQNFKGRFAIPHNDVPYSDLTPAMLQELDEWWEGPYGRAVKENAARKRLRRKQYPKATEFEKRNRIRRRRVAFSMMLRNKYPNDPSKWLD